MDIRVVLFCFSTYVIAIAVTHFLSSEEGPCDEKPYAVYRLRKDSHHKILPLLFTIIVTARPINVGR